MSQPDAGDRQGNRGLNPAWGGGSHSLLPFPRCRP